jgi:LPPG:FO 2-phospho-L-lactate transferase
VSIEPILAVPGVRAALRARRGPVLAVTPIIGGKAIKGPAAKMLTELGLDASGGAVARRYQGLIDGFVIDQVDPMPDPLEGVTFFQAATLMARDDDRLQLAHATLRAADSLAAARKSH